MRALLARTVTPSQYIMDDVTISGEHVRAIVVWEIKRAIHRSGLRYHKEKTFVDRPAEVTGIIVRADGLRAPNRQLLKIKTAKSQLLKTRNREQETCLLAIFKGLTGQVDQIKAVNKASLGRSTS